MLIAMIDVYGEEGLSVNCSKTRTGIFKKTDMQKRFEKWLSQTGNHPDPSRSLQLSRTVSIQGFTNESRKTTCLSESG
jgi:hypothetical protein